MKTPEELLYEMTGYTSSKKTDPVTIPKNWICQLCEQYADQFISLGIGDPKKIQLDSVEIKKEVSIRLREKGYSLRQIQKALGYKSVRSIVEHLKSK